MKNITAIAISNTVVLKIEYATTSECVLRRRLHDISSLEVLLQGRVVVASGFQGQIQAKLGASFSVLS